jgi:hypothetical protein
MPKKKAILIKPLSKPLIEQALVNVNGLLTRDHDGDLTLIIPSDKGEGDLGCCFLVEAEFFHLVCTLGSQLPRSQWPTAIAVCDAYHRYSILGRAVLNIREGQDLASLRFEAGIDCSDGVSDAFLQTFIVTHLACACFLRDLAFRQKVWSSSATTGEDAVIAGRLIPAEA